MMKRGVWLLAGVVLGAVGYHRARRVGQALTGGDQRALAGKRSALLPAARPAGQAQKPGLTERAVGTAKFVRDVRAGMSEYRSRHRDPAGSTLGSQDRGESQPRQHRRTQQESEQDRQAL